MLHLYVDNTKTHKHEIANMSRFFFLSVSTLSLLYFLYHMLFMSLLTPCPAQARVVQAVHARCQYQSMRVHIIYTWLVIKNTRPDGNIRTA